MLPFVRIWIWISTLATLSGWILSAGGQLNRTGYAVFFGPAILVLWCVRKKIGLSPLSPPRAKKWWRSFRRPLPLSVAGLFLLIFLGGVIHAPDNYTGLAYHVARVLQWLSHDRWLWVHTENYRMNDRACGFEWLAAPVLAFTHSIRPLFLLNFIPSLLLPGLTFSVLTGMGVRARVAWQWMWLLPTGYIFLLQAGSIANDTFPTVYILSAMAFALRFRRSGDAWDAWYSMLAVALLTGAKASNLPLLLPWIIALWPQVRSLPKQLPGTVLVVSLAVVVSFVPTAILNAHHCGDWSGTKLEPAVMMVKNPLFALVGNGFQLSFDNFWPPFCPFATAWNLHAPQIVPRFLASISEQFNNGIFHVGELPTEDWAGLGAGVSVLLMICAASRLRCGRPASRVHAILIWSPWVALLAYASRSGMDTAARLIAPYYPLLLPLLLAGAGPGRVIRRRGWHILVALHLVAAALVIVLTPDRPLWPTRTVLSKLAAQHPSSQLLARAQNVYAIYADRADSLAGVRALLPQEAKVIGFAGGADDSDFSLWQPFGSCRVEHFLLNDPPATVRAQKFDVIVLGGDNMNYRHVALDDWLKAMDGELINSTNITLKVSEGPRPWYVVRLR